MCRAGLIVVLACHMCECISTVDAGTEYCMGLFLYAGDDHYRVWLGHGVLEFLVVHQDWFMLDALLLPALLSTSHTPFALLWLKFASRHTLIPSACLVLYVGNVTSKQFGQKQP
jgi:hypothetical protein